MFVGWVFGDGCWISLAIGVGAGIGLGGEIHVIAWGDASACGMHCVVCGIGCDGVQFQGGVSVAAYCAFARITPALSCSFGCRSMRLNSLCFSGFNPCGCVCAR